jgi:hypothetical protein
MLLAEAIAEITRRYDNLFETHFPYSMGSASDKSTSARLCVRLTIIVSNGQVAHHGQTTRKGRCGRPAQCRKSPLPKWTS